MKEINLRRGLLGILFLGIGGLISLFGYYQDLHIFSPALHKSVPSSELNIATSTATSTVEATESAQMTPIGDSYFFFTDGENVYYDSYIFQDPIILTNTDPDTFEIVGATGDRIEPSYAKDKDSVYVFDNEGCGVWEVPDADVESFRVIPPINLGSGLSWKYIYTDKNQVFLREYGNDPEELVFFEKELDPEDIYNTAEGIGFGNEKMTLLYKWQYEGACGAKSLLLLPIEGLNAINAERLGVCGGGIFSEYFYYGDGEHIYTDYYPNIYRDTQLLEQIDAKTFTYLGMGEDQDVHGNNNYYAKDKDHVFINCGETLQGADPAAFEFHPNIKG